MNRNKNAFINGVRDGIPIALGYFAVAFSLGIVAKKAGLNPARHAFSCPQRTSAQGRSPFIISFTNAAECFAAAASKVG